MRLFECVMSIMAYILIGIAILVLAIPWLFFLLMPKTWLYRSKLFYRYVYSAYWLISKCTLLRIKVVGAEHIPSEPAIIAANHQSALDIPLVGVVCRGKPHLWLAWSELWDRISLRFFLATMAFPLDITSPHKALRSLVKALNTVQDYHLHAIIFPEGGRFTDGKIHDFYAGFVILVKKTGRPLVPVYIDNAYKVYPPGAFIINRYPIQVTVGQPMTIQEGESDDAFKDRVYQWFVKQSKG